MAYRYAVYSTKEGQMIFNALTLGLIAALAWGIHDFAVRFASRENPLMTTLLSVLLIGLIFHGVFMNFGGPLPAFSTITAEVMVLSIVAGVFFLGGAVTLYVAFHRGPVKLVAPIIGSYPIASLFFATINGAPSTLYQWLAVLVIVAGVAIVAISAQGEEEGGHNGWLTAAISGAAAICFAATFDIGQQAAALADERVTIFITRLATFGLLLMVMVARGMRLRPDKAVIPLLVVMGLMDALALFCVLSAGGLPDAKFAAVASSVFGLITILLCWAILRERLTLLQWLGCFASFAGIGYLAL